MSSNEELKASLTELRAALAAGKPLNDKQRATLESVLNDVGSLLEGEGDHEHESVADQLREAAQHFEESHPDLTLAVGSLANVLSRMGI